MEFEKLKSFIDIAKESGASSLKYEKDDEKFSISFGTIDENSQPKK